jgi:hypothetical protein
MSTRDLDIAKCRQFGEKAADIFVNFLEATGNAFSFGLLNSPSKPARTALPGRTQRRITKRVGHGR